LQTRAGFIAIVGAPNAGKSTLLNGLLGEKLAIVSPKVQTTRTNLRGVLTVDEKQYIFVDTPGIHKARRQFDQAMVDAAYQALIDADVLVLVVDCMKGFNKETMNIVETLESIKKNTKKFPPLLLALNKIDKIDKTKLLPMMEKAGAIGIFDDIIPLSALKAKGCDIVLQVVGQYLPETPFLYDPDTLTDMPSRLWAAEATRERAFLLLGDELPYSLSVETMAFDQREDGSVEIHQNVYLERDGQKKIIVGKNGQMLKKIGEQARKAMSVMFGGEVHLYLQVKIRPNWASDIHHMRMLGLEPNTKKRK